MRRLAVFWVLAAAVGWGGCSSEIAGPNRAPVAVAGVDRWVEADATVELDAGESYDPDGDRLVAWHWELLSAPAGVTPQWLLATDETASLEAGPGGIWVVRLTVSDGTTWSGPDVVRVTVRPVACNRDADCDDRNPCTRDSCDPQGRCAHEALPDGADCDDGRWCTVDDACDGTGACRGAERDCTGAAGQCNRGVCNEDLDQCEPEPADEGTPCDDGLFCSEGETCQAGACTGGVDRDCDDGDPCTRDGCDEAADSCTHQLEPRPGEEGPWDHPSCDDGADNDCDRQVDGDDPDCQQCSADQDCDDGNPCTGNTCGPDGRCVTTNLADGAACDDGLFCTDPDGCTAGVCGGPPRGCGHLDTQCARGVCDEQGDQCRQQAVDEGQACDDGSFCTTGETCQGGACTGGAPRDCSGLSDACNDGVCNEAESRCEAQPKNAGTPCGDQDDTACTDPDTCDGNGSCALRHAAAGSACPDTIPADCAAAACDGAGQCDQVYQAEIAGTICRPAAGECDFGELCDGESLACPADATRPDGTACAGQDEDPCTSSCRSGVCSDAVPADDGQPCDDGDDCSSTDTCQSGACQAGATDKDTDEDGYLDDQCPGGDDCDDGAPAVHPGAAEDCSNGVDDNCDGMTDGDDPGCAGDWWDPAWSRRRKLTFDNTGQSEHLDDFPVLVVLTAPDRIDYGATRDEGQDIRFVDEDDTTVLAHEIEDWYEEGTSWVWVEIPRIDSSSGTDFIWMYYNNPGASDGQQPAQVWSNGYQAVYHFHDDLDDSTASGFDGTNHGTTATTGAVAGGRHFNIYDGDYIDLGSNIDLLRNVQGATLSAWIEPDSIGNNEDDIVSISVHDSASTARSRASMGLVDYNEIGLGARASDSESYKATITNANVVSSGNLYCMVGVIDYTGDTLRIYRNGARIRLATTSFAQNRTSDTSATSNAVGAQDDASGDFFDGMIDELRISGVARSEEWIRAQYLSMSDAGFVLYGDEEIY